jgi:hypothetical protein
MKIDATCPRCSGSAPLLENKCPDCHASLMTGCRRCRAAVHLAEGVCWNCRVEHPAAGHPSSLRDGLPVVVQAPPPVGDVDGAARGRKRRKAPQSPESGDATAPTPPTGTAPGSHHGDDQLEDAPLPAFLSSKRARHRRAATVAPKILLAMAMVAGVGGVAFAANKLMNQPVGTDASASAPTWDPRITDLAAFVETQLGLKFERPVTVVLADPEFARHRGDDLLVEALSSSAGVWRAVGDAAGVTNDGDEIATLAELFANRVAYDHDQGLINVSSDELDLEVRAELVGQLTLALLAQHLAIDAPAPGDLDATTGWVARLLGTRDWTIERYLDQVSAVDTTEGSRQLDDDATANRNLLVEHQGFDAAPYTIGVAEHQGWLTLALEEQGVDRLDVAGLFSVAAPGEIELLVPGRATSRPSVESPSDGDGDEVEVVARGRFGALHLLVLLGERLGFDQSLSAASEWGNDRYLVTRTGSSTCLDLSVAVAAGQTGEALRGAFEAWTQARPDGPAPDGPAPDGPAPDGPAPDGSGPEDRVTVDGIVLSLHTCSTGAASGPSASPGTGAEPGPSRSEWWSAALVQTARARTIASLLDLGAGVDAAACVADSTRGQLGNDGFVDLIVGQPATTIPDTGATGGSPSAATPETAETVTTAMSATGVAPNKPSVISTAAFTDAWTACVGYFPELSTVVVGADTVP